MKDRRNTSHQITELIRGADGNNFKEKKNPTTSQPCDSTHLTRAFVKKISLYLAEKSMLELLLAWQLYTALKGEAEHPGNKTLLKIQTAPKKDPKALKNL